MLSDVWIRSGFIKKEIVMLVPTLIYLKLWVNHSGDLVGVGIDFELADDIHYELRYSDWLSYLQNQFGIDGEAEFKPVLSDYFENHDWLEFENSLNKFNIKFDKIAFW